MRRLWLLLVVSLTFLVVPQIHAQRAEEYDVIRVQAPSQATLPPAASPYGAIAPSSQVPLQHSPAVAQPHAQYGPAVAHAVPGSCGHGGCCGMEDDCRRHGFPCWARKLCDWLSYRPLEPLGARGCQHELCGPCGLRPHQLFLHSGRCCHHPFEPLPPHGHHGGAGCASCGR